MRPGVAAVLATALATLLTVTALGTPSQALVLQRPDPAAGGGKVIEPMRVAPVVVIRKAKPKPEPKPEPKKKPENEKATPPPEPEPAPSAVLAASSPAHTEPVCMPAGMQTIETPAPSGGAVEDDFSMDCAGCGFTVRTRFTFCPKCGRHLDRPRR